MFDNPTRRGWLAGLTAGAVAPTMTAAAADPQPPAGKFKFCLNSSTVRTADGKSRPLAELIDLAAGAGYQGLEPWVSELDAHAQAGGSLKDAGKRLADAGLSVPDAIGFAEWVVDDPARRKKGLEQAKRDMDAVRQVGGTRLAAPPVGMTGREAGNPNPTLDLLAAADRYRELFDLGKQMGVTPVVEVWGFSKTLRRLGEALLVAAEGGRAGGCVLPDVYHLYKGGSDFAGLGLLSAAAVGIFHVNDYPAVDRDRITDADRVYPGDGVAPLKDIFATLRAAGYDGFVSLELFNRGYWKQDPKAVARTGLEKLRAVTS